MSHHITPKSKIGRQMTSAKGSRVVVPDYSQNSALTVQHNKRVEEQRQIDLVKRQQRREERERWKR